MFPAFTASLAEFGHLMRKTILAATILLSTLPLSAQTRKHLDTTTFVVLGEGLAAGMADFSLRSVYQEKSFPAIVASQIQTAFPQPLMQAPGIGEAPGFPSLPVMVPAVGQTTGRAQFPPTLFVFNLAVPGHRLNDAVNLRPKPPLVHSANAKQTITNMILGYPAMILGPRIPLWSQLEYAVAMNPTLVLVELGYAEALEAAAAGDPNLVPDAAAFGAAYGELLRRLRENYAEVIATSIPDPADTAYFSSITDAAELTQVPSGTILARYSLQPDDLLTPAALTAIGAISPELPEGSVIRAATAGAVSGRVHTLNTAITAAAQQNGALVYDLNGFFSRLKAGSVAVGTRVLNARYLGGFYSLSGYYPGTTGHALIANEVLTLLNQAYGTSFPKVDVAATARSDPAARFRPAEFGEAAE